MHTALLVIEVILGLTVIISVLAQPSKSDALSGLVQGSKNETFFAKNKGRTKEAMKVRVTSVSMFLFMVVTLLLNILK